MYVLPPSRAPTGLAVSTTRRLKERTASQEKIRKTGSNEDFLGELKKFHAKC
jgi:hypothetical protein